MAIRDFVFDLILNIALMVLVAHLLSMFHKVQDMLLDEHRNWKEQLMLSLIFAAIIVLSTYTSIDIGDYQLNTRVIGAMASGLLGGPIVGLFASLMGAVYVYFFSVPQTFAMASAFSTMIFGLLGGGFAPYFQRGKWKYKDLFLLACFAECFDMSSLLRFSQPTMILQTFEMIKDIAIPMILLNSLGILIFISSFNQVFVLRDMEISRQLQLASELSKKCLPLLQEGFNNQANLHQLAAMILEETHWAGVMLTDREQILEWQQKDLEYDLGKQKQIPDVGKQAIETCQMQTLEKVSADSPLHDLLKDYSVIAAPIVIREESIGCILVCMKKQWVVHQSEIELLQHLVTISSFQIAIAQLEQQKVMLQKAEFKALQFQVNPHFLFNALNTISSVCRENPDRARELLIVLANYFRYNLNNESYMVPLEEELDHVRDYLELEQARFEENLTVTYQLCSQMNILIPTLILQPIVENAVRYGRNERGRRIVVIQVEEQEQEYMVSISDEGPGISEEIQQKLEQGEPIGNSIGLSNVHKRMKNIYGEDRGLEIESDEAGTCVRLHFMKETRV